MRIIVIIPILFLFSLHSLAQPPDNDICLSALLLPTETRSCDADTLIVRTGTTTGSLLTTAAAPFSQCFPSDETTSTQIRDVWYRFVATNNTANVEVNSTELNEIQVVIFSGFSCRTQQAIKCGVGNDQLSLSIATEPGDQYWIRISGEDANDFGNFTLAFSYGEDCGECFKPDDGRLELFPLSSTGQYFCGDTVEMCLTMTEWDSTNSNEWIHSVVPYFGSGWDLSSLEPVSAPESCNGAGNWNWYPNGWASCQTGRTFPYGFAYESSRGTQACAAPAVDGDPGNNWGDGGGNCTTSFPAKTFCWRIRVKDCADTFFGDDLTVNVVPHSDGESGSWSQATCLSDSFSVFSSVLRCEDLTPLVETTNPSCADAVDATLRITPRDANGLTRAFDVIVRDDRNREIFVFEDTVGTIELSNLNGGRYSVETYTELTNCSRVTTVNLADPPRAEASIDFEPACPGTPVRLTGTFSLPGVSEYFWQGPEGFTTTDKDPFVTETGFYILSGTVNGCPVTADTSEVSQLSVSTVEISPDKIPCTGQEVTLRVSRSAAAFRWYDVATNATLGNEQELSYVATEDINYGVEITTTDNCIIIREISVPTLTAPTFSLDQTGLACTGDSIRLSAFSPDEGLVYEWQDDPAAPTPRWFTPTAPANYTFVLTATAENGCQVREDLSFSVNTRPTAAISATPTEFCVMGGSVTLLASGGTDIAWEDGSTDPFRTATVTEDTLFTLRVTAGNGCTDTDSLFVPVYPELPAPEISCGESTTNAVTFTWLQQLEAAYYELTVNGLPAGTTTDTSFRIDNLPSDESVVITVQAYSGNNCGGAIQRADCATLSCQFPSVDFIPIDTVCLDGSLDSIPLEASLSFRTEGDTVYWEGPGVRFNTDGFYFYPASAGEGSHELVLVYENENCRRPASSFVTVSDLPRVDFMVASTPVCVGDTLDVDFTGADNPDNSYTYLATGGTLISQTDAGDARIHFPEPLAASILLTVSSGGCTDSLRQAFPVEAGLPAPMPACARATDTTLTFEWPLIDGADAYDIILPDGQMVTVSDFRYTLEDLEPGGRYPFSIRAVGTGDCALSAYNSFNCITLPCPDVTFDFSGTSDSICLTSDIPPQPLRVTVLGDPGGMGTLTWSGPGVVDDRFDPGNLDPGTYRLFVEYQSGEAPCITRDSVEIQLLGPPNYNLDLDATDVCVGDTVTATYPGTLSPGTTVTWSAPGSETPTPTGPGPHALVYADPGLFPVSLTVTDAAGCSSELPEELDSVRVSAPLSAVELRCGPAEFERIVSEWDPIVGASGYLVSEDGGPFVTQTTTGYTANGLSPGDSVRLIVQTEGVAACAAPADTLVCYTRSCPEIALDLSSVPALYCRGSNPDPILLTATATGDGGGGTFSWSGEGVTGTTFDPTGLAAGNYRLFVTYRSVMGPCETLDSLELRVIDVPRYALDLDVTDICVGDTVTATYPGALSPGTTVTWSAPGSETPNLTGPGPHALVYADPGIFPVSLTVTDAEGCTSEFPAELDSVRVSTPLPAVELRCGPAEFERIVFEWDPVVGASGYLVSEEGGPFVAQTTTGYTVDGLSPGDSVRLIVGTEGVDVCATPVDTLVCRTRPCEAITLDLSSVPALVCQTSDQTSVALVAIPAGDGGTGTVEWSGPGVADNRFDPSGLEPGIYRLVATYQSDNGPCVVTDTTEIDLRSPPGGSIELSIADVCVDQEVLAVARTNAAVPLTYQWSSPGATVFGGAGTDSLRLTYPVAGRYGISLLLTDQEGCSSELITPVDSISVLGGPPMIQLSCGAPGFNEINLEWEEVPGTGEYEVIRLDNGTVTTVPGLRYTEDNLDVGTTLSFAVTPRLNGVCGPAVGDTVTCTTLPCPPVTFDFGDLATEYCYDEAPDSLRLPISVSGAGPGDSYFWTGPSVVERSNGFFFYPNAVEPGRVELRINGRNGQLGCVNDSIFVLTLLAEPSFTITGDTELNCTTPVATLRAAVVDTFTGLTFAWSSSESGRIVGSPNTLGVTADRSGLYLLRVTNDRGCSSVDSVRVTENADLPLPVFEVTPISCNGAMDGRIQLREVTNGEPPYRLTLNDRPVFGSLFPNLGPGIYRITLTDGRGCTHFETIELSDPDPLTVRITSDLPLTGEPWGTPLNLTAVVRGGNTVDTVIWGPDSAGVPNFNRLRLIVGAPLFVGVTVIDEGGCVATDRVEVGTFRAQEVYIPSAFSPDGDNVNDVFYPQGDPTRVVEMEHLSIYNRWGELLYRRDQFPVNDPSVGWDGMHGGKPLGPQVVVYRARVRFVDGETLMLKGEIVIVR